MAVHQSSVCRIAIAALAGSFLLPLIGCSSGDAPESSVGPFTPEAVSAADTITEKELIEHIRVLSSDAFEGRGPATRGDDMTRDYLAGQLAELGYLPAAADDSWQQPFDIVGIDATVPDTWAFSSGEEQQEFRRWDDFIAASGVQAPEAVIDDAEVVFVGYGIEAPEYDWNDFKGQDLRGKVLLFINNDPEWDANLFEGDRRLYYGRWKYKYQSAARQGAAGAIIIHTTPSAGYPFQVVQTSWTGEQFELPAGDEPRVQVAAWMTEDAAGDLVALAGRNLDELIAAARSRAFEPVPLGVTTSLRLSNGISQVKTANVLGYMPGSDPELADEFVIYTAHHDHLGIGEPNDAGDRIYNGARDNAAGTSALLSIARAFKALPTPPRRSIMILFVGAEEQGLLGSQFYAEHPSVPPGRIAANINYDGGNIWGQTRDVTFIGMGKSSLDYVAMQVANRQERVVRPDQFPDRGYFYRSDQFNFAKIGVPAMYFDDGTDFVDRPEGWGKEQIEAYEAIDYHQPSDELRPDWSFIGMIADARLGFWSGLIVANEDEMPTWTPGDEFKAARLQAIEALD